MVSPVKDTAWLAWIEQLMAGAAPSPYVADLPASRFHCRLDGQPDHLAAMRSLRSQAWEDLADRPLFLHPLSCISHGVELPPELSGVAWMLKDFALQGDVLWARDPATHAWQPFWLSPRIVSSLAHVRPGDPSPHGMSLEQRRMLAMAGVLVPEDYVAVRHQQWAEIILHCAVQFRQNGYVPLAALIHPFHISALRRYYRYLIRTGGLHLGDEQSSRRYVAHNESVARFFHHQLTSAMAGVAGEPVKPSYVYLGSYQGGALLEKHTDREQCEFSITLCLDYSPEPEKETPWPLQLHGKQGKTTVYQGIGDALFYRGRELPHSRDRLREGHTSTSIFFHYVREDFAGPLD